MYPKKRTLPKIAPDNDPENGTIEASNDPKNGTQNQSLETNREPLKESADADTSLSHDTDRFSVFDWPFTRRSQKDA